MRRILTLAAASLICAACFDFLDPEFPEAGAPALLQASVFVDNAGTASLDATLIPGTAIGGVHRPVPRDTLDVLGLAIAPKDTTRDGTRKYSFNGAVPAAVRASTEFKLVAPVVEDIAGPPPAVDWFGIKKQDPDTVTWTRGTDLVLHLRTNLGTSVPAPQLRQWFVDLTGSDRQFRISSDGFPPDTLRIPSEWLPAAATGIIIAGLSFYQSGTLLSPTRDYIGNISYTLQLRWIIRVKGP